MAYQNVFQRYELKYILTREQFTRLRPVLDQYMIPDQYGATTIRNLYFDTDTFLLIRRSIEKPAYKEKLRLRSYRRAAADTIVFTEIKRKSRGVVYKRRLGLPEKDAMVWLTQGISPTPQTQISREIDYFLKYYGDLRPRVFLAYTRQALYGKDDPGFRVTFDENILCRREDMSLQSEVYGTHILPPDKVLMEIKCAGGIPLWLTEILSREQIYKTSFSKYGMMYQTIIHPTLKESVNHAG